MHPTDVDRNAQDAQATAYLLTVGMARAQAQGLDLGKILAQVYPNLPGWTILPGLGGWVSRFGLETEPAALVLLTGIHAGRATQAAEHIRATLGETAVMVVPVALSGPAYMVESLAPPMPEGWPP